MNPKRLKNKLAACLLVAICNCSLWPTESDIQDTLDQQLKEVSGNWIGSAENQNPLTLQFSITQQSSVITGSGTFKSTPSATSQPIQISGSFNKPSLSLNLTGILYEDRTVTASFSGDYVSVAGISSALILEAQNYRKEITVLLQEQ